MSLLTRYAGLVCDLDGVVYRASVAVDHAVPALTEVDRPVLYATNNASRPPSAVAAHLRELGLSVGETDVVNAAQAGAWVLGNHVRAGTAVLAVGAAGVSEALTQAGYAVVSPSEYLSTHPAPVEAVLQGYGPEVTASDLAAAAYAIAGGAAWVATNTDATLPTDRGIAPGNGALVAAVRLAVGSDPVEVAGKPFPTMYELCAERLNRRPAELLAVGDRLETDIEGAQRAGMESLLVLTGVHSAIDAALAPPARRPTFIVPDLRWLHVREDSPQWIAAEKLRAAVAEVWALFDAQETDLAARDAALEGVRKAVGEALSTVR